MQELAAQEVGVAIQQLRVSIPMAVADAARAAPAGAAPAGPPAAVPAAGIPPLPPVCTMYVCTMYVCMYVLCMYVCTMYVWLYHRRRGCSNGPTDSRCGMIGRGYGHSTYIHT